MPATALRVRLLSKTEDAENVLYAAFRQCYSAKDAHEIFADAVYRRHIGETEIIQAQRALITRIMESGHDSPIEHVSFVFAIAGISRALSHQLVRHRIASYSQQSQRYVDAAGFEYIIPPYIAAIPEAQKLFAEEMERANAAYEMLQIILRAHGYGKTAGEDARFVLPNACETKIVVTMNCRSLLHFFELRCCNRAQWEIRAMAQEMLRICREWLPVVFDKAGARCERLGYCPESEQFACGKYPRLALK